MKKIIIILVIIVVVVGGYLLLSKKQEPKIKEPVKVGALLSLTGGASAWGENAKKGIELAVTEINEKGGINGKPLEIVYSDTASDPKRTISAYQEVITIDKVEAIIGPLNQTETAPVIPLIHSSEIPTVAPGFIPIQNRVDLHNPIFVWTDAEIEAGRLAQYVYDQGVRKIGVIGTLDAWENTVTTSFVNKFKEIGGEVSALEIVQPSSSDMKLPVTKIIATKPDAIYLGTYYQFVNSVKEVGNFGYKGKLYGIEVDDYLANETAKWSDGLQFIAPDYYTSDFITKFTKKYGIAPGLPAGQSYDAAKILATFLKEGKNRNKILELMKKFNDYDGVSGKLTISTDGRTHLSLAIFEIRDGKINRISELK